MKPMEPTGFRDCFNDQRMMSPLHCQSVPSEKRESTALHRPDLRGSGGRRSLREASRCRTGNEKHDDLESWQDGSNVSGNQEEIMEAADAVRFID